MHPRLDEVRDEERDGKEADDGAESSSAPGWLRLGAYVRRGRRGQ